MDKAKRQKVGALLNRLAATNAGYAAIHAFFKELKDTPGDRAYIDFCKQRMPLLAADLMQVSDGKLAGSPIVQGLMQASKMNDHDVVKLSAVALDLVTRTVAKAIED